MMYVMQNCLKLPLMTPNGIIFLFFSSCRNVTHHILPMSAEAREVYDLLIIKNASTTSLRIALPYALAVQACRNVTTY